MCAAPRLPLRSNFATTATPGEARGGLTEVIGVTGWGYVGVLSSQGKSLVRLAGRSGPDLEPPVAEKDVRQQKLERLLRESAKLRKVSDKLAEEARRLRERIAAETKGRLAERRTKPRVRAK
jgi:hypothetical protein